MKSLLRFFIILSFFLLIAGTGGAQVVYESDRPYSIYDFLDELTNLRVISINSVVKPYSRIFIAEKLLEASKNAEHLNKRQRDEVDFYLQDYKPELSDTTKNDKRIPILQNQKNMGFGYSPPGFTYKKSSLTFSLRPVFGVQYYFNENGSVSCFSGGGKFFGYIGKHIGIYAGVTSRYQSQPLVKPEYFTEIDGYKWNTGSKGEVTNTEFTGGLTISWKWGDFGVYNDRMEWGTNYHGSNIISGRAPAFPFIKLYLHPAKWIEFFYIYGWLKSNTIDSNRSSFGENSRDIYYFHKYIAANLVTFIPWRGLNVSFGNSVISNDINAGFLIPDLFYVSVDANVSTHSNSAASNNQMFFDISSKQIKHLHLFLTLFIDEIALSNIHNKEKQSNLISFKGGFKLSDFPFKNISLITEYTRINPLVYKHFIPSQTFYSDNYCLGSYLRDNSQDIYLALIYRPFRGLSFNLSYDICKHGDDYPYLPGLNQGIPFMHKVTWKLTQLDLKLTYEIIKGGIIFLDYHFGNQYGDIKDLPKLFLGKTNTISSGISVGL